MATNINRTQQSLLVEAMPDYLQEVVTDRDFDEWSVPSSQPIGRVSIEGKAFTLSYADDKFQLMDANNKYPASFYDFILVKAHDKVSRKYYERGFVQGSKDPPDCASINGIVPEPGSPKLQAATCAKCKWSQFGTAIGPDGRPGKGQRCAQYKRVVVLLSGDTRNVNFGGPMLLTIPPTSFAEFEKYAKTQKAYGRSLHLINTRISFASVPHAQLDFEFNSFIAQNERDDILWWRDSNTDGGEYVDRVLRIEPSAEDDVETGLEAVAPVQQVQVAPEPVPAPAPAPTPAPAPAPTPAPAPAPVPPQRAQPQARPQPPRIQQGAQTPMPPQAAATRATQAPAVVRAQTSPQAGQRPVGELGRPQVAVPNQPPVQAGAPTPRPRPAPAVSPTQSSLSGPATTVRPNGPVRQVPQPPQAPTMQEAEYAEVEQIVSDMGNLDFNIP